MQIRWEKDCEKGTGGTVNVDGTQVPWFTLYEIDFYIHNIKTCLHEGSQMTDADPEFLTRTIMPQARLLMKKLYKVSIPVWKEGFKASLNVAYFLNREVNRLKQNTPKEKAIQCLGKIHDLLNLSQIVDETKTDHDSFINHYLVEWK